MEAGDAPQYVFYDIDHLRKASVAKSVETSPIRYSILRSRAPRFPDSSTCVPFGAYDIDTAHKQSVEHHCRDNRRFYASSFESTVPRFKPWSAPIVDKFYDPERTKNCKANSIEKAVETTGIQYALHRSKYKRFGDMTQSAAPDVVYEIDAGNKESLYTGMLHSPIIYKNVGSSTDSKFQHKHVMDYRNSLCPGMYEPKLPADISISPALENRPMSSMVSRTSRFGRSTFTGYGLGSTYRPENDARKWTSKELTISRAEYLRPQYLPKIYLVNKDGRPRK